LNDKDHTYDRRRAGRVIMRVPVEVCGVAQDGTPMEESAHTVVVSPHGALIRTSRPLQLGSEVTITNRFSHRTGIFRVAWIGENQREDLWEIGIDALGPHEDFWGVRFPPLPARPA
jgi:PilZ domain-containing protein